MNGRSIRQLLNAEYKYSEIILQYLLDKKRSQILLNKDQQLDVKTVDEFLHIQEKLNQGMPLQYAIGKWNFFGYDFKVDQRALIPRPETELLVEEILKESLDEKTILDIGTGSGAIAITLKLEGPKDLEVTGVDISDQALELASENAELLDVRVDFIESDLFENINKKYSIIVSNPPYLTDEEYMQVDDLLLYEPKNALVSGYEGIEIYKRIIEKAKDYLEEDGKIFFEIGYKQADKVSNLLLENGYNNIKVIKDYSGLDRIVIGEICLNN